MGFHPLELAVILVIGLLIFGPKTIQSMARSAGKTVSQAKEAKDKLLAELPVEELNSVRENIARIPLSPQQAVTMLLTPEQQRKQDKQETPQTLATAETPSEVKPVAQAQESTSHSN